MDVRDKPSPRDATGRSGMLLATVWGHSGNNFFVQVVEVSPYAELTVQKHTETFKNGRSQPFRNKPGLRTFPRMVKATLLPRMCDLIWACLRLVRTVSFLFVWRSHF